MFAGINLDGVASVISSMNWEFVRRLKDLTRMKLLLKGIQTREDAQLCCENGVDGVVVSNHGGRAEETGRRDDRVPPEVVEGVAGRIPVLVDGGFRRGTDIFKALALGANAVGVGRPLLVGPRGLRAGRCRTGAGHTAHGTGSDHAAVWRAVDQGDTAQHRSDQRTVKELRHSLWTAHRRYGSFEPTWTAPHRWRHLSGKRVNAPFDAGQFQGRATGGPSGPSFRDFSCASSR